MNEDSVLIDDDDVVMVEPIEIIDEDTRTAKQVIIDIVDLDEEPLPTSKATNGDIVTSSTTNNHDTVVDVDNEQESSFARLLKNNTILNKIVQRCLNLTNNAGMSRVIHKTLMPLYKDADNKFKESEAFSTVLNTILRNLKTDPDHKFLHIKSLCEELKAGKYRRKVPFVTLTTDLKKNHTSVPSDNEDKEESDTEISAPPIIRNRRSDKYIPENEEEEDNDAEITAVIISKKSTKKNLRAKFKKYRNAHRLFNKRRKKRKTANKKTDVINIDNSDDECVITLDADDESDGANDITILGENDNNVNKKSSQIGAEKASASDTEILTSQDLDDSSNKENSHTERENEPTRSTNDNHSVQSLVKSTSHSGKENNQSEAEDDNQCISSDDDSRLQTVDDNSNQHPNKGNEENESENVITRPPDDLLVPQNSVVFLEHSAELAKARAIEEQIKFCKKMIEGLEQMEVTNNFNSSPYVQCDKYKAKIVELYKKLCKLTGNGDGNLMKQRVVRLRVAEGHPAGPVRCLERFLNNSIDETGAVPLPDFHDVLQCVTDSNIKDNLGWNKQQIMREALALFTHCGNALRKNRQKREYKDLLSLVRDKTQDEYDPANEDPLLLAKLEENKLIAKAKENEILERYSRMEYATNNSETLGLESVKVTRTRPNDSDSDSTTDEESIPRKRLKTNRISKDKTEEQQKINANKCPNKTLAEGENQVINGTCNTNETRPPINKEIIKNPTATVLENPMQNVLSCRVTKYEIPQPKELNTKAPIQNTLIIRTSSTFFTSIQNVINLPTENTLNTKQNLENTNTQNALNQTIQNALNTTNNTINTTRYTVNTTQNQMNTTQNTINTTHQQINTTHNPIYTTQNTINATTQNARTPTLHLNPVKGHTATNQIAWPETLQKVGASNRYVVAFDGKISQNTEPQKICDTNTIGNNSNPTEIRNDTVVPIDSNIPRNEEKEKSTDINSIETNVNTSEIQENVTIKKEKVKEEPLDIQTLLNALGDTYISTVFDIEDPFLVIDISSDSSDDDDL